jgi:hypothetical protein
MHRQHVGSDGSGRLIESLPIAAEDCDPGAAGRELLRRREANTAIPAGDDGDRFMMRFQGYKRTTAGRLGADPKAFPFFDNCD